MRPRGAVKLSPRQKFITIRISELLADRVEAAAKIESKRRGVHVFRSDIVRVALELFLKGKEL